jgi:hypothetical protein
VLADLIGGLLQRRAGRRRRGAVAGLVCLLLVSLPPPAWASEDVPRLDLAAAQQALLTGQVYSAPGSVVTFDPARVLPPAI